MRGRGVQYTPLRSADMKISIQSTTRNRRGKVLLHAARQQQSLGQTKPSQSRIARLQPACKRYLSLISGKNSYEYKHEYEYEAPVRKRNMSFVKREGSARIHRIDLPAYSTTRQKATSQIPVPIPHPSPNHAQNTRPTIYNHPPTHHHHPQKYLHTPLACLLTYLLTPPLPPTNGVPRDRFHPSRKRSGREA